MMVPDDVRDKSDRIRHQYLKLVTNIDVTLDVIWAREGLKFEPISI